MTKAVRICVVVIVSASVSIAGFVAVKLAGGALKWRDGERRLHEAAVIRHPSLEKPTGTPVPATDGMQNIAPLATVSVSSTESDKGQSGAGVADGVVDTQEWVARQEMGGAWIQLSWDRPVIVTEVALYDRPNPSENILGGTLRFDDGSLFPVPALPPVGTPWHVTFPPKAVNWIRFRIDRAEGGNTGLAEIKVFGALSR